MHVTGSCQCGMIKVEAEADEQRVIVCHCTDCQTFSGSAFRGAVVAARDTVVVSGHPTVYVKVAESGAKRLQAFCPSCGTPLYSGDADGVDEYISLRTGFLDQRDALVPHIRVWRRSAPDWVEHLDAIPRWERGSAGD
jgi:hypothetical protein